MFQDFKDLLSAFNAHGVKYLVVGGYAVSFHSQPRTTKDLDLFVQASPENARTIYAALSAFGAPVGSIDVGDLSDPAKFIRFGREPIAIDILPHIDGVDFDRAWERRISNVIDTQTGLAAYFISKEDLIASKLAAGRTRDLADVEEIRQAQASAAQASDDKPGKS
ncbi:MAG TPA: nucleotidyl transferase AbiEii/AbiGii toxin family protein [Bryobacteraceae bacterium]|nr:nucleotidyl transferase AbiEii/AbiGii toxin family protein [Bryobacteraceae bacterium]